MLDKRIIANIPTPLCYVREEVALGTVFQNDVCAIWIVHDLEHANDVRVRCGRVMKLDLPGLEFPLPLIQRFSIGIGFAQGFDRIPGICAMIVGGVDHSIGSRPQYPLQLQRLPEEFTYTRLGCGWRFQCSVL